MLLQSKQLGSVPLVSMHTGQVVGQTAQAIINPHKLEIAGYYCQLNQAKKMLPILLTQDIRQATPSKIFIDSADELVAEEELLRHQDIIGLKYDLVGKTVRTNSGQRLGKVEDYVINTDTWQVQKIYVKQPLFKSFMVNSLIIDRNQISEVTDKQVTVVDAYATTPAVVTPPA